MEYDGRALDFSLGNHLRDVGIAGQFVLRDIMRVMANNLMQLSFPKSAAIGKGAINEDLTQIFNALDDPQVIAYFESQFGDGTVTAGGKLKGKKRQSRARIPGVKFNWQGDQSRMAGWHESHRRRGKVVMKESVVARRGNIDFYSGMYVPKSAMNKYRRTVMKSLGKYKAGWKPAVEYLARVTNGRMVLPAFVRKQQSVRGMVSDRSNADGSGDIIIENSVPYAQKMTSYFIKRAEMKTDGYSAKATNKQVQKIVERFNNMKSGVAA